MKTIVTFAAALLVAAPALAQKSDTDAPDKLSVKDKQFIEKATSGGMAEVKMARLALDKAESAAVRDFAQRMIDDHGKANDRLKAIAARYSMPVPTSLDTEDQKIYEKLALMRGKEFDREYAKVMKKDHDKDVKEFERASNELDNPDLREFAAITLPTLKEHDKLVDTMKSNK